MRLAHEAKKHGFEALISVLLTALIGIYCHALYEQKGIRKRVRSSEVKVAANTARMSAFERELEARTESMKTEVRSLCNQFDSQVVSLERLIGTLIGVLRQNGVNITKEDGQWDTPQ